MIEKTCPYGTIRCGNENEREKEKTSNVMCKDSGKYNVPKTYQSQN